MKKTAIIIIASLLFVACQQKAVEIKSKTIICGKVTNYEKVSTDSLINIIYHDFSADYNRFNVWISNDGSFHQVMELDAPKEIMFNYVSQVSLYANPGDSVFIEIDGNCKLNMPSDYQELYACHRVSGTTSKMNTDVMNYNAFFNDSIKSNSAIYFQKIKECTPDEYKLYHDSLERAMYKHLEVFNLKYNTCESFQRWVNDEVKYERWFHLLRYPWMHLNTNQLDVMSYIDTFPKAYFDFIEFDSQLHNEKTGSKNYLGAMQEYYNTNSFFVSRNIDEEQVWDSSVLYADTICKLLYEGSEGFNRDVLIAEHYLGLLNANLYTTVENIFDASLINNKELHDVVVERFHAEKVKYNNPEFAIGSRINQLLAENDFLQELIKQYPNKVLYLDFWAPWCGPCMEEMPWLKAIKNQMAGKDIVFVYLATRCDADAWKTTIADKKIEGEHYHLNDAQTALLNEVFEVRGIPHFAIIDKEGSVVHKNAVRPSSGDELIALLETYLN